MSPERAPARDFDPDLLARLLPPYKVVVHDNNFNTFGGYGAQPSFGGYNTFAAPQQFGGYAQAAPVSYGGGYGAGYSTVGGYGNGGFGGYNTVGNASYY